MKALTTVAAVTYAIGLWMFAPESVWRREVEQARRNQQNRLTGTPEPIQQPQTEPILEPIQTPETGAIAKPSEPTPEPIPATVPTPKPITEIVEPLPDTEPDTGTDTAPDTTPQQPDYSSLPITQLRELAKQRKLNWRPLVNGKRTPLKKPELIQLLTT